MKDSDVKNFELLKYYTVNILEKCRIKAQVNIEGVDMQFSLRIPSGDMKYTDFWVRDAAMMAESGLIGENEIKDWLVFISLVGQNGHNAINLENDLVIPPWAIADHITYEGTYNVNFA